MRTNIVIDNALMKKALQLSGSKTKKEAVEKALEMLIKVKSQKIIKKYRGKLKWQGNLNSMRSN